jgi:hypothetical protein
MRSRALSTLLASLPLVVAAAAGTGAVDATAAGPPTTIAVPGDQPTIQAAIAAASPGDTIAIAPGVYDETLVIDKSLSLVGSGASATFLYHEVAAPLISITSSTVEIRDLELNGGTPWIGGDPGWFFGSSARGIVSEDSDLVLADLVINQFSNFAVTVNGGSIDVADVALQAQDRYRHQCDVGFQLNSCVASFDRLASESGWIDHTINVNDPPAGYSQVTLTNSTITSSELSWGDGIRAYSDVTLHVADNTFNRQPGGAPATAPNHTGVSINGFDVDATIAGNLFSGVPYGVVVHGSLPDSNSVKIENCTFENVEKTGVLVHSLRLHELGKLRRRALREHGRRSRHRQLVERSRPGQRDLGCARRPGARAGHIELHPGSRPARRSRLADRGGNRRVGLPDGEPKDGPPPFDPSRNPVLTTAPIITDFGDLRRRKDAYHTLRRGHARGLCGRCRVEPWGDGGASWRIEFARSTTAMRRSAPGQGKEQRFWTNSRRRM